jgi:hypothetical protein
MSNWTPSIVPRDEDQTYYFVLDDLKLAKPQRPVRPSLASRPFGQR